MSEWYMYFSFLCHVSFDGSISKSIKIVLTETLFKEKNCFNSVKKKIYTSLLLQIKTQGILTPNNGMRLSPQNAAISIS